MVFAIDPQLKTPFVHQYSVGIQRELGFQTALEVRYVGTQSSKLWRGTDYNQLDIFSNGFFADYQSARSNFLLTGNAFCATAGCQPLTIFQSGGTHRRAPGVGTGGLAAATLKRPENGTPPTRLPPHLGRLQHPTYSADRRGRPSSTSCLTRDGRSHCCSRSWASYRYDAVQSSWAAGLVGPYFQANHLFART